MRDEREERFQEDERQEWQEKWFDTPGDVDDFIFFGYDLDDEYRSGR